MNQAREPQSIEHPLPKASSYDKHNRMIKIKIKVKPEDFVVSEAAHLPLVSRGEYCVYKLTKNGWNTLDLLLHLSRVLKIPYRDLAYGGRKDRHALTTQHITIHNPRDFSQKGRNYSLELIGYMQRPMGPDLIEGNNFNITVRGLSKLALEQAIQEIPIVKQSGLPNYFDDQRFGSIDTKNGFFAQKILLAHFNGALKIYLCGIHSEDSPADKIKKSFFLKHWADWQECLKKAETEFEKTAFRLLIAKPRDFLSPLKNINREDIMIFFSAYQAHLWNETLRRIIQSKISEPLKKYPGRAGDYLFYRKLAPSAFEELSRLVLPLAAAKAKINDASLRGIYEKVLQDESLRTALFNKLKLRQAFFKPVPRPAIIIPKNLSFLAAEDELYKNKHKLQLSFQLPRGSFGTMLIKRLTS